MRTRGQGITFLELLIIVSIMTLLAMVVVPEFSAASGDIREETLRKDLQALRQGITRYHEEHEGCWPTEEKLVAQLTLRTNLRGEVCPPDGSADAYPFGPYLERFPSNPFVNRRVADRVDGPSGQAGDGNAGWFYDPKTGGIIPDDALHKGL